MGCSLNKSAAVNKDKQEKPQTAEPTLLGAEDQQGKSVEGVNAGKAEADASAKDAILGVEESQGKSSDEGGTNKAETAASIEEAAKTDDDQVVHVVLAEEQSPKKKRVTCKTDDEQHADVVLAEEQSPEVKGNTENKDESATSPAGDSMEKEIAAEATTVKQSSPEAMVSETPLISVEANESRAQPNVTGGLFACCVSGAVST